MSSMQITREDTECLKDAFALFDADKDGEITTKELAKVSMILKVVLIFVSYYTTYFRS